jgi:hypothetical protein
MSTVILTANPQEAATTQASRATQISRENTTSGPIGNEIIQNPNENQDELLRATNNPSWWPADHRRIPGYRPAHRHPEWNELTNNTIIQPVVVLVMFGGCHLLAVGDTKMFYLDTPTNLLKFADWLPRQLGFDRSYFTYRVAGEW